MNKINIDDEVLDIHGNVLSDIYGEPTRDTNGYVIPGLDNVVRDARGRAMKDVSGQVLYYKKNTIDLEERELLDGVIKDDKGKVIGDSYGAVKRNNNGEVIVGSEGVIRDSLGYVMKNAEGKPLIKGRRYKFINKDEIDPFTLITKPYVKTAEIPKEYSYIIDEMLKIKIPKGYFEKDNLELKDLLDKNSYSPPVVSKTIVSLAPEFFIKNNTAARALVVILSYVLTQIPWETVRREVISKILEIISKSRKQANLEFVKFVLNLEETNPEILKVIKKVPFKKIIALTTTAYIGFAATNKMAPQALNAAINSVLKQTTIPLLLESKEESDSTRKYLEEKKIINVSDSVINLGKLGLLDENTVKDNKGIKIKYMPGNDTEPLYIYDFVITNKYISNIKKNIVTRVNPVDSSKIKELAIANMKRKIKNTLERVQENKNKHVNAVEYMKIVKNIELNKEIMSNIKIKDDIIIQKYLEKLQESDKKRKDVLNALGIKDFKTLNVIFKVVFSSRFSDSLRKEFNIMNRIIFLCELMLKDSNQINMKNVNVKLAIFKDALNYLENSFSSVKKFDPRDPVAFYKK